MTAQGLGVRLRGAWNKRRVYATAENSVLFTFSLTLPFGKAAGFADWRKALQEDFPELDWGEQGCWDCVELASFNAPMGRLVRLLVLRVPPAGAGMPCAVLWPREAGLLGEAEALMIGLHPQSPAHSCENLVWVLQRAGRLCVLVCHDGRPVHWLCEEGWTSGAGLQERLQRFSRFLERDPLLGEARWQWVFSTEWPVDGFPGSYALTCDLERGLARLQGSALQSSMPNAALRSSVVQAWQARRMRLYSWTSAAVSVLLVALLAGLLGYLRMNARQDRAQAQLRAEEVLALQARGQGELDSLLLQAGRVAGYTPLAGTRWRAGDWFALLDSVASPGAVLESMRLEARKAGYVLDASLLVKEFADADSLAQRLRSVAGVLSVSIGEKRKVESGVRFRLEVGL